MTERKRVCRKRGRIEIPPHEIRPDIAEYVILEGLEFYLSRDPGEMMRQECLHDISDGPQAFRISAELQPEMHCAGWYFCFCSFFQRDLETLEPLLGHPGLGLLLIGGSQLDHCPAFRRSR